MSFIADLHIHSAFSRATSKQCNLEHLNKWAQIKGLHVVATGDFVHPQWLDELEEKLMPAEPGLFKLKDEFIKTTQDEVYKSCRSEVRFILSTEISNIYKKNDRVRKNHNVILSPSFGAARKLQNSLDKIGNIKSDGRPILGLDAKDLLEIVLETDDLACLIPAHIWTPWFSVLGSKSGFDSIDECFEDLTPHIFALETGLSSDPPMNWRVSSLDRYTLVSNSDAHSPNKLAREANIFNCELSYPAMIQALKDGDQEKFGGTLEFFPEEGKYHFDGHRKCNVRMSPEETAANKEICPVCGKKMTLGVLYRVENLADRKHGAKHDNIFPFQSLIPLPEIIAEVKGVGPNTKTVQKVMDKLLSGIGSELKILRETPLPEIEKISGSVLAEAIRRMRAGELNFAAGYDGEFGTVKIFTQKEINEFNAQTFFFEPEQPEKTKQNVKQQSLFKIKDEPEEVINFSLIPMEISSATEEENYDGLNKLQFSAINTDEKFLLIIAGPGTGKTKTLTHRIAHLIENKNVNPKHILAVTFTNKAAEEMKIRLNDLLGEQQTSAIMIKTFHSLGNYILRQESSALNYSPHFTIYNEADKLLVLKQNLRNYTSAQIKELAERISTAKNLLIPPEKSDDGTDFMQNYQNYQNSLKLAQAFDFDDLITQTVFLLQANYDIKRKYQEKFQWISVDEYQDINFSQYQLLQSLVGPDTSLCAIGDPDQAIYGFRGSDLKYFLGFTNDFPEAKIVQLEKNYRSTQTILNASIQVIEKNSNRDAISLWSNIISEGKLDIFNTPTEKAEAETIVHQIEKIIGATSFFSIDSGRVDDDDIYSGSSFSDIAVLFRTNGQLPALEEAFIRSGIPYQAYGETPFWEKKEVKEISTYLRLLLNPDSDTDLLRVLNVPPRGIGEQTIHLLNNYKTINNITLWQSLEKCQHIASLSETQKAPINLFIKKINDLRIEVDELPLQKLIKNVINQSGLNSYFKNDNKRNYYWQEILASISDENISLTTFLENIALQSEVDIYNPKAEKVTLLTMHASKGLEFPIVFIAGCEDGLIPYSKENEKLDIEEERRLFYVAMTRAKQKLILTHAASRFLFGKRTNNSPSPFLADIEYMLKAFRKAEIKKKRRDDNNKKNSQMSLF